MSYVVAGIAGIAFFAMSVALLGIWPKQVLATQTAVLSPPNPLGLSVAELRGRDIYAREGCAYCHTQQVRHTPADVERFGAPTLAWETRFDFPHLWGTRRIGPDLARAGATRSEDWHYAHLFAPRALVPLSIMPAYPSLFDGSATRPRQEARDLVAYLETLGRAREVAWPEGDAAARTVAQDHQSAMALDAETLNAHPGRSRPRGDAPALPQLSPADDSGRRLWTQHCAGCHGTQGRGDGPAATWLRPQPTNLTAREYASARLADVLWNGVLGTAMPAWRDQPSTARGALAAVVREFAATEAGTAATADQLALGRSVYAANCTECHGDTGRGDGFAAGELPIVPTDFAVQRASFAEATRVLRNGIDGTSMAPWTDRLTDTEIEAVAHYVRGLYAEAAP
jgi:cytochrome c oxidase cbb3-type subunit 2/cytochrome c oxidase cbb3-type subunit I/II